ncbi:hypothetical protein [Niveispirillum sp.]|uniref:hypothetical protein n=1 Tax=Niveispirillum sp. TaxID=1917217 RepID=UPI001B709A36|nr:hypothetical protein [Niveispirillum sp.]MBP7335051.1 hypothetical protein [Niveispirillum sp.]
MALFIDEDGQVYYGFFHWQPVWTRAAIPFFLQPRGDEWQSGRYLRQLSPAWAGWLPKLTTAMACFHILLLKLAFILWWSGMGEAMLLPGVAGLTGNLFLNFLLLWVGGRWVRADHPVRLWANQPREALAFDVTAALCWVPAAGAIMMQKPVGGLFMLAVAAVFLASGLWQIWRCR